MPQISEASPQTTSQNRDRIACAPAAPAYTADMRHAIDPRVDCVFKALLGAESNRDLLIHFVSVQPPTCPISANR